jgi:antitoxin component of MazEF toxin-antitoxin module
MKQAVVIRSCERYTLHVKPRVCNMVKKTSRVLRWGNGLGLRIPQQGVDQLKLREGDTVSVQIKAKSIVIQRSKPRKKWTEEELLRGITPNFCGPELIHGSVGKEV